MVPPRARTGDESSLREVLGHYGGPIGAAQAQPLGGAGGFSGARLWKIAARGGPVCLRRWPAEHPDSRRLDWIHTVVGHLAKSRVPLPVPLRTLSGPTFVRHGGRLWQLEPWLPGSPAPVGSLDRLATALRALARVHLAGETLLDGGATAAAGSPAAARRLDRVEGLIGGGLARLAEGIDPDVWPQGTERARRLISLAPTLLPRVRARLAGVVGHPVRLGPCLRDVHRGHVLFEGEAVSGIVDMGAIDVESVAADIARLVGSFAPGDSGREGALAAYREVRPLSPDERELAGALELSGALLGPLNWIEWIYVDGRRFDDYKAIAARFDHDLDRLTRLCREIPPVIAPGRPAGGPGETN